MTHHNRNTTNEDTNESLQRFVENIRKMNQEEFDNKYGSKEKMYDVIEKDIEEDRNSI